MKNSVDLTILDTSMPGMGGHNCLQELLKINRSARVLISSGYSEKAQACDSMEAGAVGFIGKPYQINSLLGKVRNILDNREMVYIDHSKLMDV